jgi:hypothetical protein
MNKSLQSFFALAYSVLLYGCARIPEDLPSRATELRILYQVWVERGRPSDFDTEDIYGNGKVRSFFVYTNVLNVGKDTYHCRFGTRELGWPAGTLAVTDEGIIVWVRDKDGKVTVSPEKRGIE